MTGVQTCALPIFPGAFPHKTPNPNLFEVFNDKIHLMQVCFHYLRTILNRFHTLAKLLTAGRVLSPGVDNDIGRLASTHIGLDGTAQHIMSVP